MLSHAAAAFPHCPVSSSFFPHLTQAQTRRPYLSSLSVCNARPRGKIGYLMGFADGMRVTNRCRVCGRFGFVMRCGMNWEGGGDMDLEAEILEFMRTSSRPNMFPSKKQLVDAGRMDLVEAIEAQGGWLSLGWDSDSEEVSFFQDDCDFRSVESNAYRRVPSVSSEFSHPASYSEVSVESESENSSGVEGILSRLEKERNTTFGLSLRDKGVRFDVSSNNVQDDWSQEIAADGTVAGLERRHYPASLNSENGTVSSLATDIDQTRTSSDISGFRNSLHPELWQMWTNEDFEVHAGAGINRIQVGKEAGEKFAESISLEGRDGGNEHFDARKDSSVSRIQIDGNQIKTHLQHLESELSTVLQLLRSKTNSDEPKNHDTVPKNQQELSDAWEFQENEIMHARDRLRSLRAKLAVLEGKMALSIIDTQKIVEEKQKKIDEARRAMRLLRTACVVWPNPASEVLLSGSFDGWATQRKMEKSLSGVFSICLKLYPGRYEIKFIVDGVWKIDPLRPIVNNNGYENNLLIIT